MFVASPRWIDQASAVTYRTMRTALCKLNSCVEAGCIAVGLAERYGYLCEPVAVAVRVTSPSGREVTYLPGPDSRRQGGFAGHLVVTYPGVEAVVDLTADQFHAPRRGLVVPAPLVIPVGRDDLNPGVEVTLPGGTRIEYRELVDDVSWKALPAWTESSEMVIELAKRRLDAVLARV